LALSALAVSLWERRGRTLAATGVALLADYALVGGLLWVVGGTAIAYWLFVLPLLYALYRSGAAGAWLGGGLGGAAVYLTDWLRIGALPTDATTLSWAVGMVGLGGALGWLWQRRVQSEQLALLDEAARAVERVGRAQVAHFEIGSCCTRCNRRTNLSRSYTSCWSGCERGLGRRAQ
jgi:hypothetical protein